MTSFFSQDIKLSVSSKPDYIVDEKADVGADMYALSHIVTTILRCCKANQPISDATVA